MGYKAPVLRDADKDSDPYALTMLAAILDGHDAARFNKKLVREDKVALSVGIDYDSTARGPGMIYLHGSPSEGRTIAELEAALRAEITRIQQEGVSEKELKRAKAQLVASQVYKLDSMFGQAMEIGQTEAAGIPYQKIDHAGQTAAGERCRSAGRGEKILQRRYADHRRPRAATPRRQAAPRGRRRASLSHCEIKG